MFYNTFTAGLIKMDEHGLKVFVTVGTTSFDKLIQTVLMEDVCKVRYLIFVVKYVGLFPVMVAFKLVLYYRPYTGHRDEHVRGGERGAQSSEHSESLVESLLC